MRWAFAIGVAGIFASSGCILPDPPPSPSLEPPPAEISPYYYVDQLDHDKLYERHGQQAILWGRFDIVQTCGYPEGCDPRHRLLPRFEGLYLAVRGEPSLELDRRLVSIRGTFVPLEAKDLDERSRPGHGSAYWPSTILRIDEIKPRGEMVFPDTIWKKMAPFVEQWYGCQFPRSQTDFLDYWGGHHHFGVRWNYYYESRQEVDSDRFIAFWFSPKDGEITYVQEQGLKDGPYECWERFPSET